MDHGEVGVGPVGERGALVTMRYGVVGGHGQAHFLGPLLGHLPDNHGVSFEARLSVVQDCAVAPHDAPVLEVLGQGEQLICGHAQLLGDGIKGSWDQFQVLLHRTDGVLVGLGYGYSRVPGLGRLFVGGCFVLARFNVVRTEIKRRALLIDHVEVDTDLEEPFGRHDPLFQGPGLTGHVRGCSFKVVFRWHCQGEPQVVVGAFPCVIVAYAGVLVDLHSGLVQLVRLVGHGHQGGLEPETAGVEDGADLAQHVGPFQFDQTVDDLLLADPNFFSEFLEGMVDHWEGGLD